MLKNYLVHQLLKAWIIMWEGRFKRMKLVVSIELMQNKECAVYVF